MNKLSKQRASQECNKIPVESLIREVDWLTSLRSRLTGRVIVPGDPDYDETRAVFYGGNDGQPAVIVRVANVTDIQEVISIARETGLELAIRSGGHSSAGHSVTHGGIVLDLRELRGLNIDREGLTAWAETGLTAGEYTAAVDPYNLATGFGDTGSVGIGGITLGGGIGYLVRKLGLTIDNLLAAEIVAGDGQVLYVDADHHPDLFWAIRGGGGNFGVATRFQFRLHPVDQVVGGMLFLPATPEVIAAFIAEADAAPEELSTIANILPAPSMPLIAPEHHGKLAIIAMMVHAGDVESGMRVVDRFRKLAEPLADMIGPMRYKEMFPPEDKNYHPTAVSHTMFIDHVNRDVAGTTHEYLQASDATMRVAQLRVLGGAMARVPSDATAFAHRQSRIMVNLAAFYTSPEDRVVRQNWLADFAAALDQGNSGAYVNFLGDEGERRVQAAYPGSTWDRLREIKSRYDPTNLFRLNQNIPPATDLQQAGRASKPE